MSDMDKCISNCDLCLYYDYDDEYECNICTVNLDEDEMESFLGHKNQSCPYFKLYDEYKSVQKQN